MFAFKPSIGKPSMPAWLHDIPEFWRFVRGYIHKRGYNWFSQFEELKDSLVDVLYRKRGRYVRPFLHLGTVGLTFVVILVGPVIFSLEDDSQLGEQGGILGVTAYGSNMYTQQAEAVRQFRGGEIITHVVSEGETLSDIGIRYGLDISTILWENNITQQTVLKPGMELRILPVDGIRHKVQRGETIYTIAKRYGLDQSQAQLVVDYPFNEFLNDETFELAVGQFLMVPDGVMPQQRSVVQRVAQRAVMTPDAGAANATGTFVWPASGQISQGYRFYHKAIDISNRAAGPILASDGGVVIGAGWLDNSGYGNRVMIDHGNGYITLYAHLSVVQVEAGQRVNRGDVVGQMGSTGRSTGTHLHFEIRQGGVLHNPLDFLN